MNFQKIYNKTLNETLYKGKHGSGLTIYVLPKLQHSKSYATFATKYGSIDNEFIIPDEATITKVPDGIAHFLEHKLFEQPGGGNAFDDYSKTGASANAYTSFNKTAYLFSCTDKFYENLEILLSFVSKPYFTDENVAKEQGIIGQEIRMYDDDPNWRVFFNLLEGLYVNHPIKKDIAGTTETISHIDKEILYKCYETFYNPSNMILLACGSVEPEKVAEIVDKYVTPSTAKNISRHYPNEPNTVNKKEVIQELSVASPIFLIGFKDDDVGYDGTLLLKKDVLTSILLEMLFGKSSVLYNELYEKGLINDTFDISFECDKDYAYSNLGGESANPKLVHEIILNSLSKMEITEADFERCKKMQYGQFLRMWNSVDSLSHSFVSNIFKNVDVFEFSDICQSITFDEVLTRFKRHFTKENCVISIVKPYEVK